MSNFLIYCYYRILADSGLQQTVRLGKDPDNSVGICHYCLSEWLRTEVSHIWVLTLWTLKSVPRAEWCTVTLLCRKKRSKWLQVTWSHYYQSWRQLGKGGMLQQDRCLSPIGVESRENHRISIALSSIILRPTLHHHKGAAILGTLLTIYGLWLKSILYMVNCVTSIPIMMPQGWPEGQWPRGER